MDKPVLQNDIMADGSRLFLQCRKPARPRACCGGLCVSAGCPPPFAQIWLQMKRGWISSIKAGNSVFTIRMVNIGSLPKTANAPKTYCTVWRNILPVCPAKKAFDMAHLF